MVLTIQELKEKLSYDPNTGEFIWLIRPCKNKAPGTRAGTISNLGYYIIQLNGKRYLASRLAVFYMTGKWPKEQVDHKNHDTLDDSWANLREATASQNSANQRARSKKGYLKGAFYFTRTGRWKSSYGKDGKSYHLGYFDTEQEAHEKYLAIVKKIYGEFAYAGDV